MKTIIVIAITMAVQFVQAQWVQTNGPTGTTVTKVVRHSGMLFASTEMGVFRSTNEGEQWELSSNGITNLTMWALFSDGVYIFAGTHSGMVFRSSDNGDSWEDVSTGSTSGSGCAFAVKDTLLFHSAGAALYRSSDHGTTWDSIGSWMYHNYDLTIQGTSLFTANSSVYRSTDDGTHWEDVGSGLAGLNFYSFAVMGSNLYVSSDSGVFVTTNQGTNWVRVDSGIYPPGVTALCAKDTILFASSESGSSILYRSLDAGAHWNPIADFKWLVHSFTVDNGNIFVALSRWGAFHSTDNGDTWTDRNGGFAYTRIHEIFVSRNWQNTIFASTDDHGTFRSIDNGLNWERMATYDNTTFAELDSLLFMGGSYYGSPFLVRSTDGGQTWNYIATGVSGTSIRKLFIKDNVIFAGALGVYRSTDGGSIWTAVNNGMPPGSIWSFASNDSFLFVSREGSVYSTTNDGDNWQFAGLSGVSQLEVSGNNVLASGTPAYISTDNGVSWNPINQNLRLSLFCKAGFYSFAASSTGGFYRSTDHGLNWDSIGTVPQYMTYLTSNEEYLFAGTYLSSVWRRPLSEVVSVGKTTPLPSGFRLYQNHPNPFNPTTEIIFQMSEASYVTLKVYDVLGREIATLANERREAGVHRVHWNAENVPSGVYFYKLQAGRVNETKKLLLMK